MCCGSRPISRPADGASVSFDAALADARDAGVGLHRDDHIALVEQRIGIGRHIGPHARDLHLRNGGESSSGPIPIPPPLLPPTAPETLFDPSPDTSLSLVPWFPRSLHCIHVHRHHRADRHAGQPGRPRRRSPHHRRSSRHCLAPARGRFAGGFGRVPDGAGSRPDLFSRRPGPGDARPHFARLACARLQG